MKYASIALSAVGAFILGLSGGDPLIAAIGGVLCGTGLALAFSSVSMKREEAVSSVSQLLRVIHGVYGVHGATTEIVNLIGSRMDRELLQRLARGGRR